VSQPKPSKSAKKREYLELQDLGVQLLSLSEQQLEEIAIDESLREAVLAAQQIGSRSALRRQKQLIGKIMRQLDPAPVRAALEIMGRLEALDRSVFRNAEKWRDRIVAEGNTGVAEFSRQAGRDSERLVTLCNELSYTEHAAGRKKIRRQIFREVHQQLLREMQNDASRR
jgi:ribosome-associated protein